MERIFLKCDICYQVYTSGPQEPLLLPCGHTFCRTCVTNLLNTGDFACPDCRAIVKVSVEAMPINYALLEATKKPMLVPPLMQKLQHTHKVFIDLSIGYRQLGRVHINIWCQMRRAQYFFTLCLGSFGFSFFQTSFSCVENKGQEGEHLVMRKFSPSIDNEAFEWGEPYTGPVREGVVMGIYSSKENQYCFGICTRHQIGGIFQCPFGEVATPQGMEVVLAAVQHEPISEVMISDCGIVVADKSKDE